MALSSIGVDLINKASPIHNDFSIGNRLKYITTDGELSSATINGPTVSSGTQDTPSLIAWNPPAATGSNSSAYWTSAGGLTAGAWNTTWAYIRLDTALDTGDVVTITNLATIIDSVYTKLNCTLCSLLSILYTIKVPKNIIIRSIDE